MLKRRTLLIGGAGAALMAGAGVAALSDRRNRYRLKVMLNRVVAEPQLEESAPTGTLSDGETATIVALALVILPPDAAGDAAELARHHAANRCARVPGYLAEYQRAARLLDERSVARTAQPFAALPVAARDTVLRALLWSYSGRRMVGTVGRYVEQATVPAPVLAMRRFVIGDLLAAFYASAAGWATVGYTHYPGTAAADPREYTRRGGA